MSGRRLAEPDRLFSSLYASIVQGVLAGNSRVRGQGLLSTRHTTKDGVYAQRVVDVADAVFDEILDRDKELPL